MGEYTFILGYVIGAAHIGLIWAYYRKCFLRSWRRQVYKAYNKHVH